MAIIIVASAIAAIIFILIVGMVYSQMQNSKKSADKHRSLLAESRELQNEFKLQLQFLIDAEIIDNLQKQRLAYLASNFFVFQTINDKNMTNMMTMTKYFTDITTKAMNIEMSDQLVSVFSQAASIIPTGATGFTPTFYSVNVTKMLMDLNQNIDRLMKGDYEEETETDLSQSNENKETSDTENTDDDVQSQSEDTADESNNEQLLESNQ